MSANLIHLLYHTFRLNVKGKINALVLSKRVRLYPKAKALGFSFGTFDKVIRLIEIEGQAILERQAPGLLPFTPLMQPPTDMDSEQWVQACIDATRATPVDQQTQADLLHGISVFGGIVYNAELLERLIPEELMQESKTYQRQLERMRREATIENTLELLIDQFHPEAVRALTPILQNIEDLQRLKELHLAAARVPNIETFAQMLHE